MVIAAIETINGLIIAYTSYCGNKKNNYHI